MTYVAANTDVHPIESIEKMKEANHTLTQTGAREKVHDKNNNNNNKKGERKTI